MKIISLKENPNSETIKPIGRTREINGIVYHIMGFALYPESDYSHFKNMGGLRLFLLEFNQEFANKAMAAQQAFLSNSAGFPKNNRAMYNIDRDWAQAFGGISTISIGSLELKSGASTSHGQCYYGHRDLFTRFLQHGWEPSGIASYDLEFLWFSDIQIEEDYKTIPDFDKNAQIRLTLQPRHEHRYVNKPIKLSIGSNYNENTHFTDDKGQSRWIRINRVYLYNYRDEAIKQNGENMDVENINRVLDEIYPEGTCQLVIEYESEDDIQLNFYSKRWLDKPSGTGLNMSFVYRLADDKEKRGILGHKLKSTYLTNDTFLPDTTEVEAELLSYSMIIPQDDIIF